MIPSKPRFFAPGLFCALAVVIAIACSRSNAPKDTVQIQLNFQAGPGEKKIPWAERGQRAPASVSNMDCLLVNIKGDGVTDTFPGGTFGYGATASCLGLGVVSKAIAVSATPSSVTLAVRPGLNRTVEVIGYQGAQGGACVGKTIEELSSDSVASLYTVGSLTTNIASDITLYVPNTYFATITPDRLLNCRTFSAGATSPSAKVYKYAAGAFTDLGLNATAIHTMQVFGTNVYVGGDFQNAGGNSLASYFALYDIPTSTWWTPLNVALNGPVRAVQAIGSNLYIGGDFTDAGGNTLADGLAWWNGTTLQAMGGGIGSGTVKAMAYYGSNLYVGGTFPDIGGNTSLSGLAKWIETSGTWGAMGFGSTGYVNALSNYSSILFIGGNFTDVGGNVDADHLATYNGSTLQAAVSGGGLNAPVRGLYANSATSVWVAGEFTNAGGNTNANYAAQLSGGTWFGLGAGLDAPANAVTIFSSINLFGGDFNNAGGTVNTTHIAKYVSGWVALSTGLNGAVTALTNDGTNAYVGGAFTGTN